MGKRTALYDWHVRHGGKMVEFAGWDMPVQYASIVQEHNAVRERAGVFDVSHMGQVFVEGDNALAFLQKICTNDLSKCGPSQAMYSHLCNERGGVVDDIFVYCLEAGKYLVVVNAGTTDKDFAWMKKNCPADVMLTNASARFGMIAVQGPKAVETVRKVFPHIPERHRVLVEQSRGERVFVCRTGYTGEDGVEIIAPNEEIEGLLEKIMAVGQGAGILPCGLGARDTLRLESGYLLYGSDVDDDHSPLEAGVPWVVKFDKGEFVGKAALLSQKNGGLARKLTAFMLTERGIPRHGFNILCDGKPVGVVSSGTFSPSLQKGIAMGYVPAQAQGAFAIECHGKPVPASIVKLPFYSKK